MSLQSKISSTQLITQVLLLSTILRTQVLLLSVSRNLGKNLDENKSRIALRPHPISLSLLTRFYYYGCAPFASSRLVFKIRNPSIFLFLLLNSFLCASSFYLHSFFISSISPSGLSTPYNSTLLVSPLLRTASAFYVAFRVKSLFW